jgi:hypothetical protein
MSHHLSLWICHTLPFSRYFRMQFEIRLLWCYLLTVRIETSYITDEIVIIKRVIYRRNQFRKTGKYYSAWLHTGRPGFDPRQWQRNFPLACVQASPEAHPASCPMVTRVPFPVVNCGRGETLTTYPRLVSTSRRSRSYTFSPPCSLHGGTRTAFTDWGLACFSSSYKSVLTYQCDYLKT